MPFKKSLRLFCASLFAFGTIQLSSGAFATEVDSKENKEISFAAALMPAVDSSTKAEKIKQKSNQNITPASTTIDPTVDLSKKNYKNLEIETNSQDETAQGQSDFFSSPTAISDFRSKMQDLVMYALSLTDVRYRMGGSSPEGGLDCSGLVRHVFQQIAELPVPHNAHALSQVGQRVQTPELQPGDLVFFNTRRRNFSHVGIYLGSNRFIHAPNSRSAVQISNMTDNYWSRRFNGARRIQTEKQLSAL